MKFKKYSRFLLVIMIISKHSNDDNRLDAKQISEYLEAYGLDKIDRNKLKDYVEEIKNLQELDIWEEFWGEIVFYTEGKKNKYGLTNLIEESELRILSDLVYSSKALCESESKDLILKLDKLINNYSSSFDRQKLFNIAKNKTDNKLSLNLNNILEAIKMGKQVKFNYCEYDLNKKLVCKKDVKGEDKVYIANPIDVFFKKDFYYLVLNKENKVGLSNYRIDKILNVRIIESDNDYDYSQFNLAEYVRTSVYMFSGDIQKVKLEIDKKLMGYIIDELGKGICIKKLGSDNKVSIEFKATVDKGLVNWILQFGCKIKIIEPIILKKYVIKEAEKILYNYK